jgi:hypothetical protein
MSVYLDPSHAIQASVPSHALPCFAAEQLVVSPGLRNSYRQVFGTAVGKPTHPGCDEENDQKTKKTTLRSLGPDDAFNELLIIGLFVDLCS